MSPLARSLSTILAALLVAAAVVAAGSYGGATAAGVAVIIWCAVAAFAINWIVYVPSALARTERFYDLTGTLTYLSVVGLALVLVGRFDARSLLLAGLVAVWSARLGIFLARRVFAAGSDSRFDSIKQDPVEFLVTWTLQGLWVTLTLAAALGAMTAEVEAPLGWSVVAGVALWVLGFGFEAIADRQKSAFRSRESNDGEFITEGLWAWSRHPNYFGELTLWVGIALIALPALQGWRYVTLISPVFVYVLLTRISGVPPLERSGERRWGDRPDYRRYVESTPVFFPRPPTRSEEAVER